MASPPLIETFRLFVFDMDGVLYRGAEPLPRGAELVARLKNAGALVRFMTNNSLRPAATYARRIREMGIPAEDEEVLTSSDAARRFILSKGGSKETIVMAVGESGLTEALSPFTLVHENWDGPVDYVAVGQDRKFTWTKLTAAHQAILKGAAFIAANTDSNFPAEGGKILPGAGAIVASIRTSTGVAPEVMGKPNPRSMLQIMEEVGVPPEKTIAIGDRYETDIESANRAGAASALVLTGIAKREAPETLPPEQRPDFVFEDLRELEKAIFSPD